MNQRLLVATRKGLFDYHYQQQQWQLNRRSFLGEPVSAVAAHNGDLYAALNLGHFGCKLHRSEDQGHSWQEVAVPTYPKVDGSEDGPSLTLIWTLEAVGDTLWAGTIPGGLFRSDDRGESWQLNQALWRQPSREQWFGGGYDQPGIHSICIDPHDSQRLTVAISCGGVWTTADGGESWRSICQGMRADYVPPEQRENPAIQDPHRLVQCAAAPQHLWVQHHNGIFKSSDYGEHWQEVVASPSSFGFALAVHPAKPETAWFVPAIKDEYRYPPDAIMQLNKTEDGGQQFRSLRQGLPQQESYDLVYRHALDIDAQGKHLAMGSTTGNIWVTEDGGEHWQCLSNYLPPVYAVRFI